MYLKKYVSTRGLVSQVISSCLMVLHKVLMVFLFMFRGIQDDRQCASIYATTGCVVTGFFYIGLSLYKGNN